MFKSLSMICFKKNVLCQWVTKYSACIETESFLTAHHWSLSWARWIHVTLQTQSLYYPLIYTSSHLISPLKICMFSSFPYACYTFRIVSKLTATLTSFPWFYTFLPLRRQSCNFTCTVPIFLYFKSLKATRFASVSIYYSSFSWKWHYITTYTRN